MGITESVSHLVSLLRLGDQPRLRPGMLISVEILQHSKKSAVFLFKNTVFTGKILGSEPQSKNARLEVLETSPDLLLKNISMKTKDRNAGKQKGVTFIRSSGLKESNTDLIDYIGRLFGKPIAMDMERVNYLYSVYKQMSSMIKNKGAFIENQRDTEKLLDKFFKSESSDKAENYLSEALKKQGFHEIRGWEDQLKGSKYDIYVFDGRHAFMEDNTEYSRIMLRLETEDTGRTVLDGIQANSTVKIRLIMESEHMYKRAQEHCALFEQEVRSSGLSFALLCLLAKEFCSNESDTA